MARCWWYLAVGFHDDLLACRNERQRHVLVSRGNMLRIAGRCHQVLASTSASHRYVSIDRLIDAYRQCGLVGWPDE